MIPPAFNDITGVFNDITVAFDNTIAASDKTNDNIQQGMIDDLVRGTIVVCLTKCLVMVSESG